jgi:hypothetical protein
MEKLTQKKKDSVSKILYRAGVDGGSISYPLGFLFPLKHEGPR